MARATVTFRPTTGFQSIGVTKEWRPFAAAPNGNCAVSSFQSIGVTKEWRPWLWRRSARHARRVRFPINRRHQRMATGPVELRYRPQPFPQFPINRRHQRMATAVEMIASYGMPVGVSNQ